MPNGQMGGPWDFSGPYRDQRDWQISIDSRRTPGRTHGTISCSHTCKDGPRGTMCADCRETSRTHRAMYRRRARERKRQAATLTATPTSEN